MYSTQFRQDEKEEMKEAAEALIHLLRPRIPREISIHESGMRRALALFPSCREGDTILLNFFVDHNLFTNVIYIQKEHGEMRMHRMDAPYHEITIPWTYQVTDFRF